MPQPRQVTSAANFIAEAGRFLHGRDRWLTPLAADLGVKPETIQSWLKGKSRLTGSHPVIQRAHGLVVDRLRQQEQHWRERFEEVTSENAG
jgi:hypothetical protein